ncbi:MAG: peptidylprolyl isomerase [Nitrospinae bacterium]|nr:peptidylprolyl isomerase [Nitrospinota bacterium]MBL7020067.1 peptidylprolyl isomerase [Nitrospinaceae bacterium]
MLNKWLVGIALGMCLIIVSCSSGSLPDELAGNAVIAVINNEEVSLDRFKIEFEVHKKKFRVHETGEVSPEELLWLKNRTLEQIVKNTLFRQEAKTNNIGISQEELDEALLKAEAGYAEDSFKKQLEFEGLTRKDWEKIIENNLLINKLINNFVNSKVSVSDDEMLRYFEANESRFHKREQVRALHIMVETEGDIRQIQKELQSKQKDFSALAREYSLGPEGIRGGDLGYFEAGQMPEEFDNVFKLKINGVSDIIRTPYGFHLFKVVDKIENRKMSFEESKNQVEQVLLQDLQNKAFQKWMIQLKENSVIEINYDFLEKIN